MRWVEDDKTVDEIVEEEVKMNFQQREAREDIEETSLQ